MTRWWKWPSVTIALLLTRFLFIRWASTRRKINSKNQLLLHASLLSSDTYLRTTHILTTHQTSCSFYVPSPAVVSSNTSSAFHCHLHTAYTIDTQHSIGGRFTCIWLQDVVYICQRKLHNSIKLGLASHFTGISTTTKPRIYYQLLSVPFSLDYKLMVALLQWRLHLINIASGDQMIIGLMK